MAHDEVGSPREIDSFYTGRREQREWSQRQTAYQIAQARYLLDSARRDGEIALRRETLLPPADYSTAHTTEDTPAAGAPQPKPRTDRSLKQREQAIAHFNNGDYQQALAAAESAVAHGLGSAELYLLIGACYLELDRPGAAVNVLNRAVKVDKASAAMRFARGVALDAHDHIDEACDDFLRAAKLAPSNREYCISAAFALMALGQHERAVPYFDRAEELGPGDARISSSRGYCYERLHRVGDAFDDYDGAVTANPGEWHHYFDRGRMLLARQRIIETLGDAETVIRLAPDRPHGYRLRALCFLTGGRLAEAQRDLLHALTMEPDDAETCLALADCREGLRDFQEAIKSLRRAEQLYEQNGDSDGVAAVAERIRGLLGAR